MKTFYLVLLLNIFFISSKLTAQQTTYIPDDNFEQALIDLGYDNVLDNYVATNNIISITNLDIRFKDISDLTGIESFTALTYLNCAFNSLTNLDLSNNTTLRELYCAFNSLTSLDLSNNNALTYLDCGFNKLDVLDVRNKNALTVLYSDYNSLTSLNVKNGNNTNFTAFNATNNAGLTCIEVDNAAYSNSNWPNKDAAASYSTNCNGGGSSAKFSNSKKLNYTSLSTNQSEIETSNYKLYPNPVKDVLNISLDYGFKIKQVDFYNAYGQRVLSAKTTKIDLSSFTRGVYFVDIETNQGKSIKKIIVE